jgi:hypothetical protein
MREKTIWRISCVGLVGLGLAMASLQVAEAAEGGQSPYLKGYRDGLTGLVPPQPGLYLRNDLVYYGGDMGGTVLNGRVEANLDVKSLADVISPTYVTSAKILGGTYAVNLAVALVYADVTARASAGPFSTERSDSEFNLGDTIFTPAILGWHDGNFHWNLTLSVYAPTGKYDTDDLANVGKNYWSLMPQIGATYFDPATGWDISGALIYVSNFENSDTDYDTGDLLHLDMSVSKHFGAFSVGAVGYAMRQITDDSGSGAVLGGFRSHVYGLGPSFGYTFEVDKKPIMLLAKWYHEFDAENTTEGDTVTFAVTVPF